MRHPKITHAMLLRHMACHESRAEFLELFGYSTTVTYKNLLRAAKHHLSVYWFMTHFLPYNARNEFRIEYTEIFINNHFEGDYATRIAKLAIKYVNTMVELGDCFV